MTQVTMTWDELYAAIAQTERDVAASVGEKTDVPCPALCGGVKRVGMLGMSADMDVDERRSCRCVLSGDQWMDVEQAAAEVLCH